jgi:hypothetical protein
VVASKPASRVTSRNSSRRPRSREALRLLDTRGRSKSRGDGSTIRSPSSPLPMSPQAKLYQDDDGDDLKKAVEDQMRFRSRHRSTSRVRERGTSSVRSSSPNRRRRDRSTSRKPGERHTSKSRKEHDVQPRRHPHSRRVSEAEVGDIKRIKDERTLKKEQAARELEERRKSLARRPSAPPIVHPEELARLSPMSYHPMTRTDYTRATLVPTQKSPPITRSQTTSPESMLSGQDSSVQIGLPATPRAMRHPKYDPEGKDIPDVPQIPERYDNTQPPSWGSNTHTLSYNNAFESLAPLPKSVYQSPPRRVPPRSASAPIPAEPVSPQALPAALPLHPAFHAALPPSTRRRPESYQRASTMHTGRKINPGDSQPGTLGYEARNTMIMPMMSGIEETLEANTPVYGSKNDSMMPPPPPPPPHPPILPELKHLMVPPPPPPAPIAPRYAQSDTNTHSVVSGVSSQSSTGMIEIVMGDDEPQSGTSAGSPQDAHQTLPAVAHQAPPLSLNTSVGNHSRGRSENDNSIAGRFSRAAERLRSASRGRNTVSPAVERTRSPQDVSPYESVAWPVNRATTASPGGHSSMRPPIMTPEQGGMI